LLRFPVIAHFVTDGQATVLSIDRQKMHMVHSSGSGLDGLANRNLYMKRSLVNMKW
jgi:hypothetical protein